MKRILMATDLTARCDRALQRAIALASEFKAELRIIHVVEESFFDFVTDQHEAAAREAIEKQIEALPQVQSLAVSIDILRGVDYQLIIEAAEQYKADLIVLGIHRHEVPEMFRGTTAERVIRYGRIPVLVIKNTVSGHYRTALAAVDLSNHARAGVDIGARLVPTGLVYLLHVAHRSFPAFLGRSDQNELIREQHQRIKSVFDADIGHLSGELGPSAPRFDFVLQDGEVIPSIRNAVASLKPDLLVVGTHGRTGIGHAILGSVAEDLLVSAPVDVLAVKSLTDSMG